MYHPEIVVTTVEGGDGLDHAKLMKQSILNRSISRGPSVNNDVKQRADAPMEDELNYLVCIIYLFEGLFSWYRVPCFAY